MCNRATIFALCTLFVCVTVASTEINDTKVSEIGDTEPEASSNLCLTPACIHAASTILMSMNSSANPCDDFYEFACGNYANSVSIPVDYFMVSRDYQAEQILDSRLQQMIENIDESNASKPFRLVKAYYEQCINHLSIWKNDPGILTAVLDVIANKNGWPLQELERWNSTKFKYSYILSSLFDLSTRIDKQNVTARIRNIGEHEPPLNRHYLQEGFSNEVVQAYYRYMTDIAVALGFNETIAKIDMNETLSLEIELYQKVLNKHDDADWSRIYSKTTSRDLQKRYPSLEWYTSEGMANFSVQLEFDAETMDRAMEWILGKSKRALANWAAWRTIQQDIPRFGSYFAHIHKVFLQNVQGKRAVLIETQVCLSETKNQLGFAVFALYQRKFIGPSSVDDMIVIFENLREQFSGLVQKADWLDLHTRKTALEKLSNIQSSLVTCREPISDDELEAFYSELELSSGSFPETSVIVEEFINRKSENVTPSNRIHCGTSWLTTSYMVHRNFLQMAAEQFTGFFYDIDRQKYLNYGIFSRSIGHEMGHSLDIKDININKNGDLKPWSNSESKEHYMNRLQCFIDQYQKYTIDGSKIHLNGYSTLNENIADYTGAKIAYYAYVKWANTSLPEKRLPGLDYSPNRMFWIAMASSWCAKYPLKYLKNFAYEYSYSPNKFRVNGPLSNLQEFSNDFRCSVGTSMNPVKKCHLW